MPAVVVQVGQCGNQVGGALWGILAREADGEAGGGCRDATAAGPSSMLEATAGAGYRARCVLVDAEPKAVRGVLAGRAGGLLSSAQRVCGHSGRGNNWAHGYQQPGEGGGAGGAGAGGGSLLEQAMDAARLEAERCDTSPDFVLLHSLAGGTGSGLGSRILEALREDYPREFILVGAVAPRYDGDSTLQSYNTLLAAQWHQAYADAVLLFSNDRLLKAAAGPPGAPGGGGARAPGAGGGLGGVNDYIGACLAGALMPMAILPGNPRASSCVREIVTRAAPDPSLKYLEVHTGPSPLPLKPANKGAGPAATASWGGLARGVAARAERFDLENYGAPSTSTATLAFLRGTGPGEARPGATAAARAGGAGAAAAAAAAEVSKVLGGSSSPFAPAAWRPRGGAVDVLASPPPALPACGAVRTATVVANRSSAAAALAPAVRRAEQMLHSGAYTHWYSRYGCPREALWDALDSTASVVESYRWWHQGGGGEYD